MKVKDEEIIEYIRLLKGHCDSTMISEKFGIVRQVAAKRIQKFENLGIIKPRNGMRKFLELV